jgi:hypothetical protein
MNCHYSPWLLAKCRGYLLSQLVLYLQPCNCTQWVDYSCADSHNHSVIICVLQFGASQPQMKCESAGLVQK